MSVRRGALLSLLVGCSAARPPPAPPVVAPVSPSPIGAHWAVAPRPLPLGQSVSAFGNRLVAGPGGQRWLVGDKAREPAGTLLDESLVAAWARPGGGFAFLGQRGSVFETETPLGPALKVTRATVALVAAARSTQAFLGVEALGRRLVRSTDQGLTWTDVAFDEAVLDVVLRPDGHGLALLAPEGVAETSDHGLTFHRRPTPIRPQKLSVGDDGSLVVGGESESVRVAGLDFVSTTPMPQPHLEQPAAVALHGDFAVRVLRQPMQLVVGVGKLGTPPTWTPHPAGCAWVRVAVFVPHVSIACRRQDMVEELYSADAGKSFRAGSKWRGGPPAVHAIGPGGELYTTLDDGRLGVRKRPGDPLVATGHFEAIRVAPDGASTAGLRPNETGVDLVTWSDVAPWKPRLWAAFPVGLGASALAWDGKRALGLLPAGGKAYVFDVNGPGNVPLRPAALADAHWALGSARGLATSGSSLFETWDGGAHAQPIGELLESTPTACSAVGCVVGLDARLGWDHPTVAHPPRTEPGPAPTPAPPPRIACQSGKTLATKVLRFEPTGGQQLLPRAFGSDASVVRFDKTGSTKRIVLTKGAAGPEESVRLFSLPEGVVELRLAVTPKTHPASKGIRPVTATAAWLRESEAKPHRADLGDVGTFRVFRGVVSASPPDRVISFVDGGVALQPAAPLSDYYGSGGDRRIHLVDDNGKQSGLLEPPSTGSNELVTRHGGRWWLGPRSAHAPSLTLHAQEADGTWTDLTLRLWPTTVPTLAFTLSGPSPTLAGLVPSEGRAWQAKIGAAGVEAVRTFTLPTPPTPCGAGVDGPLGSYVLPTPLEVLVDKAPRAVTRATAFARAGAACVKFLHPEDEGVYVAIDDPKRSYLFEDGAVKELACTITP